jgi:hypothetical protein
LEGDGFLFVGCSGVACYAVCLVAFGADVVFVIEKVVAVPGLIFGEGAAVSSFWRRWHLRIAIGSMFGVEGRDFDALLLLGALDFGRQGRTAVVEESLLEAFWVSMMRITFS